MTTPTTLGDRIRQARDRAGLTQTGLAEALGINNHATISYWENDSRVPGLGQLNALATALGVTADVLLGRQPFPDPEEDTKTPLYRGIADQAPRTQAGIRQWLVFLDRWADLRYSCGDALPGPSSPPQPAWRGRKPMTDSKRSSTFATDVRSYFNLGNDAIPDLPTFLDQTGVLVYRAPLDPIRESGSGISGAFYNHPRLGYSIIVNTNTTPGRQTFTLAHEYAHALFHYQEHSVISRAGDRDAKERFADNFAAHFLVPNDSLRKLTRSLGGIDDPRKALALQRYFRVSYATILNRLVDTKLVTSDHYMTYCRLSPSDIARKMGLDETEYSRKPESPGITLSTYPSSVLTKLRLLIRHQHVGVPAAASLLNVSQEEITEELIAPPAAAEPEEAREFAELPAPIIPKTRYVEEAVA